MGQTLTHGVYLPDEGERNCYSGLASNWQLLDGAVGTIAEHTSALSGKAPLVHTHTKSDITDFPAYGNAAGTICEGNDSRLSDARTPVAHTHTKSDVTDLLNSDFIPSANNSYNLGSSSYQWNNLYAKNYYYNGTEFTDKFVTTDTAQTISGLKYFSSNILCKTPQTIDVSTNPAEVITGKGLQFVDNAQYWGDITPQWTTDGMFRIRIAMTNYNTSGTSTGWFCPIVLDLTKDGSKVDIWSTHPNSNLGTSSKKWKTLNGVNPGALSLPNLNYSDSNQWIDLSGNITNLTGGDNWYYPAVDGWVFVITNGNPVSLNVLVLGAVNSGKLIAGASGVLEASSGAMWVSSPAPAGSRVRIRANNGSTGRLEAAWFITCQGNV